MRRWRSSRAVIRTRRSSPPSSGRRIRSCCSATSSGTAISPGFERGVRVSILRRTAFVYMLILLAAASLNYIPGLTDAQGRAFGVFALDTFDDALHGASAIWAGPAAARSTREVRVFLRYFGLLYLTDGLLGLATGSGYLDFGIVKYGVVQ